MYCSLLSYLHFLIWLNIQGKENSFSVRAPLNGIIRLMESNWPRLNNHKCLRCIGICSVIVIIQLMESVMVWPKVIPLIGVHCNYELFFIFLNLTFSFECIVSSWVICELYFLSNLTISSCFCASTTVYKLTISRKVGLSNCYFKNIDV